MSKSSCFVDLHFKCGGMGNSFILRPTELRLRIRGVSLGHPWDAVFAKLCTFSPNFRKSKSGNEAFVTLSPSLKAMRPRKMADSFLCMDLVSPHELLLV